MNGKFRSGNAPGFIANIPYMCIILLCKQVREWVSRTLVAMAMTEFERDCVLHEVSIDAKGTVFIIEKSCGLC